ncbi:MAG: hypothetical protein K8S87_01580 [Planctomycetes bacterium]|nr:hypothetical protein [Planctomycetota bacterium]
MENRTRIMLISMFMLSAFFFVECKEYKPKRSSNLKLKTQETHVEPLKADELETQSKPPESAEDAGKKMKTDIKYLYNAQKDCFELFSYSFTKEQWKKYFESDNYFDVLTEPTVPYHKKVQEEYIESDEEKIIRHNLHSEKAVQAAKALVEKNKEEAWLDIYLPAITPEIAAEFAMLDGVLNFHIMQKLTPEVAKELGDHSYWIVFYALQTLTPEVASELANNKGLLEFDKVKSITYDVATALAKHEGELRLSGLRELSPECAKALETHKGKIQIPYLTSINPETAQMFVNTNNKEFSLIFLKYIAEITPEVAEVLVKFREYIWLPNIQNISYEVALKLSEYKGKSLYIGLKSIEPKIASAFANLEGGLCLDKLEDLSIDAAKELGKMKGLLYLPIKFLKNEAIIDEFIKAKTKVDITQIDKLTPKLAKLMIASNEIMLLSQITSLTEEIAEILATHKGQMYLSGIERIPSKIVKILHKHDGSVFLPNLTELNPEAAKLLLKIEDVDAGVFGFDVDTMAKNMGSLNIKADLLRKKTPFINLSYVDKISPEVAEILAQYEHILFLGLTEIDAKVASKLAKFNNLLILKNLKTITVEAAKELAKHKHELWLDGITHLTVEVAREFTKHEGELSFTRLAELTPDVAHELSKHEGEMLLLPALKEISVETARELAKCKTKLMLDGLTKLSVEVAREIAKNQNALRFGSVTELDADVARELSKNEGVLVFSDLKDISDEVAQILAKHKGLILADEKVLGKLHKYRKQK